jgi:hemerythrin superfamily protein
MARDVADLIRADHRRVEEMFDMLESGSGDRRTLVNQMIDELTAHAAAEEQIVYPAIRDMVPNGREMADRAASEHAAMKQSMKILQDNEPGEGRFDRALASLISEVRGHVPAEENELLPALKQVVGEDSMEQLCSLFEQVKGTIPTGGS